MGFKTLELTLISAKDLKNVNMIGKMDVYVVVHLSDQPKSKQKTPVHQDGGTHPSWNYTMRFTVDEADAAKPGKFVVFQLKHEHSFGADKELGQVMVPVSELFDSVGKDPSAPQFVTYQVKTSSGKAKGELKFSFNFIDVAQSTGGYNNPGQSCSSSAGGSNLYPPAAGYPAPSAGAYPPPGQAPAGPYPPPGHAPGGYPMPQQAPPMGYPPQSQGQPGVPYAAPQGYPPQPGYGYPPQPAGYGYPPQGPGGYPPQGPGGYPQYPPAGYGSSQKPQKPKKNKNGFGMGLGAGLLGGAIGGLVLGEVIEDSFDGGFDDGGFDF